MHRRWLFLLLALAATPALAKSLHWRALDVAARLDRDGRLHVSERQAIVFDGDWNGGERTFRIGAGQSLKFESIARVDNGVEQPMAAGDLGKVDYYSFTSPTVLRWRSRLPGDPPFANQEITYLLHYTLNGVIRQTGGVYRLDHDFAFPDRAGVIERYSLQLDLDPAWQGTRSPVVIERKNLVPGESVVVTLDLQFAGAGTPAGVVRTLSPTTGNIVLGLFAIALAFLLLDFWMTENAKGRFARLTPPDGIDESWLAKHLFVLKPEAAGSAIDNHTGAAEVAAMLARMTWEKKISSSVETRRSFLSSRQVLCLKLLVHREALPAGEAKLVRAFFFDGDTTDTDAIRKHYKSTGFDPAAIVESSVGPELNHIQGWSAKPKRANWLRDGVALGATLALMILAALYGGRDAAVAFTLLVMGAVLLAFSGLAANANSRALSGLVFRFGLPLLILTPFLAMAVAYTQRAVHLVLHFVTLVAICAWAVAVMKLMLDLLRSPESPERIAFRKRLQAARNYFIAELRSPQPRLHDEWYPYLLAFGLGAYVDRWFSAFGSAAVQAGAFTGDSHGSSGSGASSSPSFTGGGGAFGGAGASGGWAVAAAAMGAGVSAPSSGGSGGGGGGGGSSGGGGGGGW